MLNTRGYNATTISLELLCRYFSCKTGNLIEYVPDEQLSEPVASSQKGPKAGTPAAQAGATARHGAKPAPKRKVQK